MTQLLSDRVWAELDPHAGRLPRRTSVRVLVAAAVGALVIAAIVPLVRSGVVVPHIEVHIPGTHTISDSSTPPTAAYPIFDTETYTVTNHSWMTITVTGFSRPAGVSVRSPSALPQRIPPGGQIQVKVSYQITSCADAGGNEPRHSPIAVHIHRSWGTQTVFTSTDDNLNFVAWIVCGV
jgi:hypothetical protein